MAYWSKAVVNMISGFVVKHFQQLKAIDLGHLDVKENQVGLQFLHRLQGFETIFAFPGISTPGMPEDISLPAPWQGVHRQ